MRVLFRWYAFVVCMQLLRRKNSHVQDNDFRILMHVLRSVIG